MQVVLMSDDFSRIQIKLTIQKKNSKELW